MTRSAAHGAAVSAVSAVSALLVTAGVAAAPAQAQTWIAGPCPVLWVLGVQGTGQSSPTADPSLDSGMLAGMFTPMLADGGSLVRRTYVPYDAAFGGVIGSGSGAQPYVQSLAGAVTRLGDMARAVLSRCPGTMVAGAGYSQGAQAMSLFARRVGAGGGPVPSDRVAGIALFADPDRPDDSTVFPGSPGQSSPAPAPGTAGIAVSKVRLLDPSVVGGGLADGGGGYGALTGRVADFCIPRDLACDAPNHAALLTVFADIAAQADLHDPIGAAGTITRAWTSTVSSAMTTILDQDVQPGPSGQLEYLPRESISQRLADASDPLATPATPAATATAARRWQLLVAAAAGNPLGVLPRLATQLAAAVGANIAANRDLFNLSTVSQYADLVANHQAYGEAAPDGASSLTAAAHWFDAIAHDLYDATTTSRAEPISATAWVRMPPHPHQ